MRHDQLLRSALRATSVQGDRRFVGSMHPVILSGGSGTRLWPLSRAMYPKQFIRFSRAQASSFLVVHAEAPAGLCGVRGADHHRQQRPPLPDRGRGRARRRLPAGRHPRAGGSQHGTRDRGCRPLRRTRGPERRACRHALRPRDQGRAGVRRGRAPRGRGGRDGQVRRCSASRRDAPHTGYGYIRRGAPLPGFDGAYGVAAFAEKPDKSTAERYLATGDYTLEQRHLRVRRSRLHRGAGAAGARYPQGRPGSARQRQGGSGLPAPRRQSLRAARPPSPSTTR